MACAKEKKRQQMDKFHFIAIGGIGQSALAKILLQKGYSVTGSDIADSKYTKELKDLEMQNTKFQIKIEKIEEGKYSANGIDKVSFLVCTKHLCIFLMSLDKTHNLVFLLSIFHLLQGFKQHDRQ